MEELRIPENIREDFERIRERTTEIIPEQELIDRLAESAKSGRPLTIKAGFDPTAPLVTLGWAVVLRKMRLLQDLGHQVVFLFGDFTAMIGDPTDKSSTRKPLTREEVLENAKDYQQQIFRILDPDKTIIRYNSEWLAGMTLRDTITLAARYTVTQLMQREDFSARYEANQPISVHEFIYPLLQGYDSVQLEADIEIGGHDQKWNFLVGREIMRDYGLQPQAIVLLPLLRGTDGNQKMSQSLGNYIGITESPENMYGKVMSIPDHLIGEYFFLCTDVPEPEIRNLEGGISDKSIEPMPVKARLAREIVATYHSAADAKAAEEHFNRVIRQSGLPDEMPERTYSRDDLPLFLPRLLTDNGLTATNSEARRLIKQGAVRLWPDKVKDPNFEITEAGEFVLKVGKLRFLRIRVK
jgi:tyrosyl-tRNA synthetase